MTYRQLPIKRFREFSSILKGLSKPLQRYFTNRGNPPLGDWNQWCFIPSTAIFKSVSELPISVADEEHFAQICIESVFWAQWQFTKRIYDYELELFEALVSAGKRRDFEIPADHLTKLPDFAFFITFPRPYLLHEDCDCAVGAAVYLDSEIRNSEAPFGRGSPYGNCIHFLFYGSDGSPLGLPLYIPLVNKSLSEVISEIARSQVAMSKESGPAFQKMTEDNLGVMISLLLYFCTKEPEFDDPTLGPVKPSLTYRKGRRILRAAPHVKSVVVGKEVSKQMKSARTDRSSSGARVAHYRNWHYRRVWVGKKGSAERHYEVRFINWCMVSESVPHDKTTDYDS